MEHAWHVHDLGKIARVMTDGRPLLRLTTEHRMRRGEVGAGDGRTHLTMVHAWVWLDDPDGVFAHEHRTLPYLRAGLRASDARGAGLDAANDIALL